MAPATSSKTVTVSAPGKVLLAGGYVVLESPNVGLVVAVDRRFYCTATLTTTTTSDDEASSCMDIIVSSPQFGQEWRYVYDILSSRLTANDKETTSSSSVKNVFIEKTLRVSLLYAINASPSSATHAKRSLHLTIQADNDFYSLQPHLKSHGLDKTQVGALPKFLSAPRNDKGHLLKTGLGSSACLVTSLVAAMLYVLQDSTTTTTVNSIPNLAQLCHCVAQGKVGSGFDVSAACHGSHVYQRFPKETIDPLAGGGMMLLLEDEEKKSDDCLETDVRVHQERLRRIVSSKWPGGVQQPLTVPNYLQLVLADVSVGSSSPSMAKAVLEWKRVNGNDGLWKELIAANERICRLFASASAMQLSAQEMDHLVASDVEEWQNHSVGQVLYDLRCALEQSRRCLKAMGDAANVPIEPDEQTQLVDSTIAIKGVVGAVVPGAGGYDAVACLYINLPSVKAAIAEHWANWPHANVCPLTASAISYGEGVRVEESKE